MGAVRWNKMWDTVHNEIKKSLKGLDTEYLHFEDIDKAATEIGHIISAHDIQIEDAIDFVSWFKANLIDIFEENCITFDVIPSEYDDIMSWIALDICNSIGGKISGKRMHRTKILQYIKDISVEQHAIHTPTPWRQPQPLFTTPMSVAEVKEERQVHDSQIHINDMVKANQLALTMPCTKFNGQSNYIIWKHEVLDAIDRKHLRNTLIGYYVVYNSLSELAITIAQGAEFHPDDPTQSLTSLLTVLDKQFLTQCAMAKLEDDYVHLKQDAGEQIPTYLMRFRRMADTYCKLHNIELNDIQKKIKFGSGLLSQWKSIKSLIDGICAHQSFDQYVEILTQYTSNMEDDPGLQRNRLPHFGGMSTGSKCFRCDKPGHRSDDCTNAMSSIPRCNICGMRNHTTDKCLKKDNDMKCRRCGKPGHTSACCRAPQPIKQLQKRPDDGITGDLKLEQKVITCSASGITKQNCGGIPVDELIAPSPEETFRIGNETFVEVQALMDSGANASFIHPKLMEYLSVNQLIKEQRSVDLPVTYGNEQQSAAHTAVLLSGTVDNLEVEGWFLVSNRCSPRLIFGQPMLNKLKSMRSNIQMSRMAVSLENVESPLHQWVETVENDHSTALQIRFPLLEKATVLPYKEAPRKRSITDARIMKARLDRMSESHQCNKISPNEACITLSPVLVDKHASVGDSGEIPAPPRIYYDTDDPEHESLHSRYRMTVDCRPINDMTFVPIQDGLYALQPKMTTKSEHQSATVQHQSSSAARLKKLQYGNGWFAKLDMKDAFAALRLPPSLFKIFCVSFFLDGVEHCYQYTTMPQGWQYSSYFFDIAMDHIMRNIETLLMESYQVVMIYYQDDSILNGPNEKLTNEALEFLINHLQDVYGFVVRPEKCTRAKETIDFCGMRISADGVIPIPLRKKFTHQMIEKGWQHYLDCKDKLSWARSWVGRFNYFRSFLTFDLQMMKNLEHLQSLLKKKSQNQISDELAKSAFFALANFCLHQLPEIAYGHNTFHETLGTILIADANHDAWSGILLRIVKSGTDSDTKSYPFQDSENICEEFAELHRMLNKNRVPEPFILIPIGLHGNISNSQGQRQSSTHRERHAILTLVDYFYGMIDRKLFIVCDNQNCIKNWDTDLLTGCEMQLWDRLQSIEHQFLWTTRDGVPKYADWLARQSICPEHRLVTESIDSVEEIMPAVCLDSHQVPAANTTPELPSSDDENTSHIPLQVVSEFRRALIHGYRTDTQTQFHKVPLNEIYKWICTNRHLTTDVAELSQHDKRIHVTSKHFVVEDQILHYNAIDGIKIVIPDVECDMLMLDNIRAVKLRAAILYMHHNKLLHPGVHRLYSTISTRFYWPKLDSDVRRYISSCIECTLRKQAATNHGISELGSVTTNSTKIFEMLMLDYGTFENHNILFIVDCYSHFLFTQEVNHADARSTAYALFKVITQIGLPRVILHDNGSHFVNEIMTHLSHILGYSINLSTPYLPRRNGLVESSVKGVKNSLKHWNGAEYDFVVALDVATYIHNTSKLAHFPLSPYEIVFGQAPTHIVNAFDVARDEIPRDIEGIRKAWEAARLRQAESLQGRHDQAQLNNVPFKVNDTVIVRQGNNISIDRLKQKHSLNHWVLQTGGIVSEVHLQICPRNADDISIPLIQRSEDMGIKVNDIVLYNVLENDETFVDVGKVIDIDESDCTILCYYCNEKSQWYSHGENYTKKISVSDILRTIVLNKDNRVPQYTLRTLGII